MRTSAAVVAALLLNACGADDVAIVGRCVPEGDPVRLVDDPHLQLVSPGLSGDRLLVTWVRQVPQPDGTTILVLEGGWFDATSLALDMDVPHIAESSLDVARAMWTAAPDGSLVAQQFLGPADSDQPQIVTVHADGTSEIRNVVLTSLSATHGCADCTNIEWSDPALRGGPDMRLPTVEAGAAPLFGVLGIPTTCGAGVLNVQEPIVFDVDHDAVVPTRSPASSCVRDAADFPNNLMLVPGSTSAPDTIGMLFRVGSSLGFGDTHFMQVRTDGTVVAGPALVGVHEQHPTAASGWDLVAVRIGEAGVLFRERTVGADTFLSCYRLRTMNADGSAPTDARWQLPCIHSEGRTLADAPVITASADLAEINGGRAVVAWGEHSGHDTLQPVLSTDAWWERIEVAIVGPDGRRGSEIVQATSEQSTALNGARTPTTGPWPTEFAVQMASAGARVVITWIDLRSDAPGLYGRSFRCE